MRQHPVDLLPQSIRDRAQARVRARRAVAAGVAAGVVLVVLASHCRLLAGRAQSRLEHAEERAAYVLSLEERGASLEKILAEARAFVKRYRQVAGPIDVSAVLATVCNELPDSVSLDSLLLDCGRRRRGGAPRPRGPESLEAPPRVLSGELAGFAASDEDIAVLVDRLQALPPLEDVTLDFSRTRAVRGRSAREFRLSFHIDLERPYQVRARAAEAPLPVAAAGEEASRAR